MTRSLTPATMVAVGFVLATVVVAIEVDGNCSCNTTTQRLVLLDFFLATDGPSWLPSVRPWNFTAGRTPCNFSSTIRCVNGSLTEILVPGAGLGGTLPASLANLTGQLSVLDVSKNPKLSGTLPPEWSTLANLTLLHASGTGLVGPLPSSYGALRALKDLNLDDTPLNATLPESWANMTKIVHFSLKNASLFGTLPAAYSAWSRVETIWLNENGRITGTLPPEWSALRKVDHLRMANNDLRGTLPKEYGMMTSLILFNVGYNPRLGGTLPPEWSALKAVGFLMLFACNFSGSLPSAWSGMSNTIQEIAVSLNPHLTGTLPASWGTFLRMEEFYAFNCSLTGTLPPEWSGWTSVQSFMAPYNRFTGTLPKSWGSLTNLQRVVLTGNALNGTLPPEWSACVSLTMLFLDYNHFTGTLPSSWGTSWPFLLALFVGFNQLHGTLPAAWKSIGSFSNALGNSMWSFIGNNGLSGSIPNSYPVIALIGVCNTSICGSLPSTWLQNSQPSFVCQTLSEDIFNILQNPDVGDKMETLIQLAHNEPTEVRLLPSCPTTAAPPTTATQGPAAPATTTTSPALPPAAVGVVVSQRIVTSATPTAVVASSVSSVLLSTTPTFSIAPALQSSLAALKVAARLCGVSASSSSSSSPSSGGGETAPAAIDDVIGSAIGDNPTQLDLGGSASLAGGTVVGNTILVLTCGPAVLLIRSLLEAYWKQGVVAQPSRRRQRGHGRPPTGVENLGNDKSNTGNASGGAERVDGTSVRLHLSSFFSTMIPFYGALLQPTITASVTLVTITPQSIQLWAVGVAGLLLHVLPLLVSAKLLLVTYAATLRCLPQVHPYLRRKAKLLRLVYANFVPTFRWELPLRSVNPTASSSSGQLFRPSTLGTISRKLTLTLTEPYRHPYRWMSLVELGTAIVSGVLTGVALALPNTTPCAVFSTLQWCIAALFAAASVLAVGLRPTSTRFDWFQSAVMNGLSAAVVVLSVVQLDALATVLSAAQAVSAAVLLALPAAALVVRWVKAAPIEAALPLEHSSHSGGSLAVAEQLTGDTREKLRGGRLDRAGSRESESDLSAAAVRQRLRDLVEEICYQQRWRRRGGSSASKREPDAAALAPSLSDALWLT